MLNSSHQQFSKEPRPVYYQELDVLGFDKYWNYEKNDSYPYMWAESSTYFYRGKKVAKIKGGALYTPPEILLLDDPEPSGAWLQYVDIPRMVEKNKALMEGLEQDTIKKIYNTFTTYKNKTDVMYVAFSGGKDSVVVMDLVQRALPHNNFVVVFGNTDMEFPTTLAMIDEVRDYCKLREVKFYEASADFPSSESWRIFGPPARRVRWCCTVHKTAPVINKLSEISGVKHVKSMMITGVRGDESASRADYDELSFGKKLAGQYSFHPILDWSSAEVYLYIYQNNLPFNEAYKLGFNRVGCIMCPNSSEKHEYIKRCFFPKLVDEYCERITSTSCKDLSGDNKKLFMENGGWKTRLSGRELKFSEDERFAFEETKAGYVFVVNKLKGEWMTWYKTMGDLIPQDDGYLMEYSGEIRKCVVSTSGDYTRFEIENQKKTKNSIEFIYLLKNVFIKSQYCIRCKTCVAECPFGNISMENGELAISDKCVKCHACLKIASGCLYYNSIKGSKNMKSLKGINKYLSVGVDAQWIKNYFKDSTWEPGNRKTDVMYGFMADAGLVKNRKITNFGKLVCEYGLDEDNSWALMLCNLVYTPAFGWYTHNIPFGETYIEERLELDMGEDATKKAKGEFWNGFKTILDTNPAFQRIGFGVPDITSKENKNGDIRKKLNSIMRTPWQNPDPRVILYSLYKFAEACGDYYQFTLTRLLNHEIDSDGVSPTEIFGIGREDMERILSGLSINYPEFINASFTLDLDNINLKSDKTSADVLTLF